MSLNVVLSGLPHAAPSSPRASPPPPDAWLSLCSPCAEGTAHSSSTPSTPGTQLDTSPGHHSRLQRHDYGPGAGRRGEVPDTRVRLDSLLLPGKGGVEGSPCPARPVTSEKPGFPVGGGGLGFCLLTVQAARLSQIFKKKILFLVYPGSRKRKSAQRAFSLPRCLQWPQETGTYPVSQQMPGLSWLSHRHASGLRTSSDWSYDQALRHGQSTQ